MRLSKSKYCRLWQCEKMLWLDANHPELDYRNLEGVHNGGEAMNIFPRMQNMPPEEQQIARQNLLAYCQLDTYAMVKVWQALVEAAK